MMLLRKILKCIFAFLTVFCILLIFCRNGFLQSCGIGCCMLAPAFFYPAFYGSKWDYVRITGFSLTAAVIAGCLMFISDRINPTSGLEGMELFFLQFEIFIFSIILVLITTAFCCRMKKLLKTVIPGIIFIIYVLCGSCFTLTTKANVPNIYFLLLAVAPLLLLLPLNIIMAVRILIFPEAKKPL